MKFPEDAPIVAIVVAGCILAAILVVFMTITAGTLCANHVLQFC